MFINIFLKKINYIHADMLDINVYVYKVNIFLIILNYIFLYFPDFF